MAKNKLGRHTFRPEAPVYISDWASVAGKKEAEGPLGHGFDIRSMDTKFGEKTWEQAEKKMQQLALYKLLDKARLQTDDIDLVFSGDLLNQCIGSSFTLRNTCIPHLGLYGACSTMAQSLLLSAMTVGGGYADRVVAMTSSHFAGSERQYRFPLGYGGQRTPTAQWTATGSGAALVTSAESPVSIESATIGTVTDLGITDAGNMGAAMAPVDAKLRPSPAGCTPVTHIIRFPLPSRKNLWYNQNIPYSGGFPMKTKLSSRFWVALTLFSLVGQVAWVVENMYFNVFIYKMFRASAADISAMVGASSVAATVTTVLIGALSDRIGKRKLLICGGYLVWGVSILSFCLLRVEVIEAIFPMTANAMALGVNLVIILDCVMTFFGSSANDAAFNAWVTDSTDHTNRGAVEGINSMMPLVAILVVFGGFMGFDLNRSESWTWIFAIIGGIVLCVGIAGLLLIDESKITPTKTGYFENLTYGFRPSTARANGKLYWMLVIFALFNISIQTYMPYLILYYEVSLGMSNYVLIMAPAIILAAVVTAFWGKVYDRKGFRFAALVALAALNLGYIVLYLTRSTLPVFLGSLLMMSGYLSGMAVFGAYVRDFTPAGKSGQFQGLRIFSQVLIPGVIGPAIGAAVLSGAEQIVNSDGTTSFVPNANIFAAALAVGIAVTVCVAVFTRRSKSA